MLHPLVVPAVDECFITSVERPMIDAERIRNSNYSPGMPIA